ncbi:ABC transporter permease [Acidobacteriota bacterium]
MNQKKSPPLFAACIVRRLSGYRFRHSICEDMEDVFKEIEKEKGKSQACKWYWIEALGAAFKEFIFSIRGSLAMIKNYLKIALRNMTKHKGYSMINLAGLTIGITVCLFILLWVRDEVSFDRFHENADQIYRLTEIQRNTDGSEFLVAVTPELLGPGITADYPEVIDFSRFRILGRTLVSYGDNHIYESGFAFADPSFFKMFTFPLLEGNPETILDSMEKIVISESAAKKYFGSENPIGKTLKVSNRLPFIVSGIMKDIPTNSHMRFDILGHFDVLIKTIGYSGGWWNNNFYTYIQVMENADIKKLSDEVFLYMKKPSPTARTRIRMQPLLDIHLRSNYAIDLYGATQDRSQYVLIFTVVAIVVLLIACINFMNLATARSGLRSKEIGLRKVVGARRNEIIRQFFGESILFAVFACVIAAGVVRILLPVFNSLTGKTMSSDFFKEPLILLIFLGIGLFTGFLSGIYPALFLSAFRPTSIFRGEALTETRSALFRKALVISQFSLSIVFIAGTLIISNQLKYIQTRQLGFDKEAIIHFRIQSRLYNNFGSFKYELTKNPGIKSVTKSSDLPTYTVHSTSGFRWEGMNPEDRMLIHQYTVGYDFLKTLGMEIVAGRDFSHEYKSDANNGAFVVNETAVRLMGYTNPVGKMLTLWDLNAPIIGVVKDFHYKSLHTEIEPLIMRINPQNDRHVFVRIDTENVAGNIEAIESVYQKFAPEFPLEFSFLDESLDSLYRNDKRVGSIFQIFTGLAIFISCLGLFGLASFLIERRTKEIGIRKILGADLGRIFMILSHDFLKWVAVANIIAIPVSYYVMGKWLDNFAYRTDIGALVFITAAGMALGIALLTVSYHSIRAALSNPVDSLRYE